MSPISPSGISLPTIKLDSRIVFFLVGTVFLPHFWRSFSLFTFPRPCPWSKSRTSCVYTGHTDVVQLRTFRTKFCPFSPPHPVYNLIHSETFSTIQLVSFHCLSMVLLLLLLLFLVRIIDNLSNSLTQKETDLHCVVPSVPQTKGQVPNKSK